MEQQLIDQLQLKLGVNGLPYDVPIHPHFVHFTLGLFIIAIIFDLAGTFFNLERPILEFLRLPAIRSGFFDVGWYNLLGCGVITFFTVAIGFFEMMLANPPINQVSDWRLTTGQTMLWHGVGGVLLLTVIVAMTVWRGLQRYRWRTEACQQVQWSYLIVGIILLGILYLHGTLGAQLGDEFGIHNTAVHLLQQNQNPNLVLD